MPFRVKICNKFRKRHTPIPTVGICAANKTCNPQTVSFVQPIQEVVIDTEEEFNKEYEAFIAEQRRLKAERLKQQLLENYE